MSLSTRLSVFFLAALAVVLLGFSGTLFGLSRTYLTRQMDERLEKALDTLEASVDVETGGLEWEPEDRRLTIGLDAGIDEVRWAVQDDAGRPVDVSQNAEGSGFPPRAAGGVLPARSGDRTVLGTASGWRLGRRHLRLDELLKLGKGHAEDDGPDDDDEFSEIVLTVGLSPEPINASLSHLGLALAVVSSVLWLLCAVLGRWLCRRALVPIVRMAEAAREMDVNDGGGLPNPGTGDELEELGNAFNGLLTRLHETIERQQRFTGDASHQLRTPLAGLLSLIEVIRRRPRGAQEYEEVLDQVHREADHLRQIVESLLFLARSESESVAPEGENINLSAWLPEQIARWSSHPRAEDLQVQAPHAPVWVRAHPPLLAQALGNLLDNALKYGDPGTPVSVSCHQEPSHAVLSVSDQGCGLSREEIPSIFEPFYRSPEARRLGRSGVGLGLSVVKRIVTASGGSIEIDSAPGLGTRFVLRFPTPEVSRTRQPGGLPGNHAAELSGVRSS